MELRFTTDMIPTEPVEVDGQLYATNRPGKKRAYLYGVRIPFKLGAAIRLVYLRTYTRSQ